jgi:hypothetical protein
MAKRESEEQINARLRKLAEQIRGLRTEMATELQRRTAKLIVATANERPPRKNRQSAHDGLEQALERGGRIGGAAGMHR